MYHADDEEFFDQIEYWKTPVSDCGDDRGDDLQDVRRVGPGLERGEGLGAPRPTSAVEAGVTTPAPEEVGEPKARRPLPRPPPPAGRGRCWPGRSAGWSSATSARWPSCSSPASGRLGELSRRDRADLHARQLQGRHRDARVPHDRAAGPSAIAALVTVTCALLAFPLAFYMAKLAEAAGPGLLVVAVLMPLWSSYLVKVFAWRGILSEEGVLNWLLEPFGISGPGYGLVAVWLVMTYIWLPYMIIPIYAGLERIPDTLLSASEDMGAKPLHDLPPRDPAAGLPGGDRRLDLHLLAHPRRLHRRRPDRRRASSSSAPSSTRTSPPTCRSPPRSRPCRSS